MIITEEEKNRIRKLHREHSVIKEQKETSHDSFREKSFTGTVDAVQNFGGSTLDMFANWWGGVERLIKPIATEITEKLYAEADEITQEKAQKVAKQLMDTMKGAGTDEGKFWEVTRKWSRGGEQGTKNRALIRGAFKRAYTKDLEFWIEGDFNCADLLSAAAIGYLSIKNLITGSDEKEACQEARSKALKAWGYSG